MRHPCALRSLALLLLASAATAEPRLVFRDHGEAVGTRSLAALRQALPPTEVTWMRRLYLEERTYRALPLRPLLDHVYGPRWRQAEMLMFTCRDGYQPLLATAELEAHEEDARGYLVFERVGGEGLWEEDEAGELVDYGPFRLFWKGPEGREGRLGLATPYQITGVDLIEFADRFPRLAPPAGSPAKAKAGFLAFRKNCLKCHTINGDGSDMPLGPELNYPASVTEYWRRDWLVRFVEDPATIRYETRMPGLAKLPATAGLDEAARAALAEELVVYLEAMAGKKIPPATRAPPTPGAAPGGAAPPGRLR